MEKHNKYIKDLINRYIYQVTKNLPVKSSKDIEEELQTLIYDMLEDRTGTKEPTKEDIDSVLIELGNPSDLADKYRDKSRYLIGPSLYPAYLTTLKIVIAATLLGLSIVAILGLITSSDTIWYEYLGNWIVTSLGGLMSAFAWVTIIFAIFEWRDVKLTNLLPEWEPSSLPPVESKEVSIPIAGPIANIVFSILFLTVLISSPHFIGIFFFSDHSQVVSFFDTEVIKSVLPLFAVCSGLSIVKSIWEIIERKISFKYAIFTVVNNLITIAILIIIFTMFPIWNPNFIEEIKVFFNAIDNAAVISVWNQLTSNLIIFLVIIYLIDCVTVMYKALKYDRKLI